MPKIYLSPSNQDGNMYAYGNTNEMTQCNRIASAAKKALERCGFVVKKATEGQSMYKTVQESNDWGADLHIPIHTNAMNGKCGGTVVFVYNTGTANMKYATPIYNAVQAVCPGKTDYGIQANPGLYELNSTSSIAVYVECDFHDNAEIAKWIVNNTGKIGESICMGVCDAFNKEYIPPESISTVYRVQVGAYTKKENAEAMLKKLQKDGYSDAFITTGKKG